MILSDLFRDQMLPMFMRWSLPTRKYVSVRALKDWHD